MLRRILLNSHAETKISHVNWANTAALALNTRSHSLEYLALQFDPRFPSPTPYTIMINVQSEQIPMMTPYITISVRICLVKTPALVSCGGRLMTSEETASSPSPNAGKELVSILIQRISNGASGNTEKLSLSLKASPMTSNITSPTLETKR